MARKPTKIINLTQHEITVKRGLRSVTFKPTGMIARLNFVLEPLYYFEKDGIHIPVNRYVLSGVVGLPPQSEGRGIVRPLEDPQEHHHPHWMSLGLHPPSPVALRQTGFSLVEREKVLVRPGRKGRLWHDAEELGSASIERGTIRSQKRGWSKSQSGPGSSRMSVVDSIVGMGPS